MVIKRNTSHGREKRGMSTDTSRYRERFAATLAHQPVDRPPIDLGGTPQSTVDDERLISSLAAYLGFAGERPADYRKFDRRILEHFDVDFRRVGDLVPFVTDRIRAISATEHIDCYGIRHRFSGAYWEIVEGPLQNATIDEVAAYTFPTVEQIPPELPELWEAEARRLYQETPYVIVGEHPVFGMLELACWLCGYDHIMLMLALDPEFIHLLFGKILAFQQAVIRRYYARIGRYIHLTTSGDDFGTQHGPFMSPAMFREFVYPYLRARIAYTAQCTDAVYLHHTCGAVFDLIPDLLAAGVRILNPIQPAAGMDPVRLKATYGDRLTFHGGLDTQAVLPSNDPAIIAAAVASLLAAMHPNHDGGYIFAPAHNLQHDVTPASVACMYDAAHGVFASR